MQRMGVNDVGRCVLSVPPWARAGSEPMGWKSVHRDAGLCNVKAGWSRHVVGDDLAAHTRCPLLPGQGQGLSLVSAYAVEVWHHVADTQRIELPAPCGRILALPRLRCRRVGRQQISNDIGPGG